MEKTVQDVVEDLMDEEIIALYGNVAQLLDVLQALEEIGGWQRPRQPVLETIRGLCQTLLQKVAVVQAKTLEQKEVWER